MMNMNALSLKSEPRNVTPRKILVADDNKDTISIISALLKHAGYAVVTVMNGDEAIRSAERELPDLILLDLMMPEKNGFEACRAIKENARTEKIPVLILAVKTEPQSTEKGLSLGACEYIHKPLFWTAIQP